MRLNWCSGCGGGHNFGDQLGPALLRHYGIPVEWAPPQRAQAFAVGSILSKVPVGFRGWILGTGFIQAGMHKNLSRARVEAVRGELTRKACNLPPSTRLGDLGLLAPELLEGWESLSRKGDLILPHYVDTRMSKRHPTATVGSITAPLVEVVRQVASAERVFTSSLHGLILADALGVPHVYEPHEAVKGDGFKFIDYCSALGETIKPRVERLSDQTAVAEKQAELRLVLVNIRELLTGVAQVA